MIIEKEKKVEIINDEQKSKDEKQPIFTPVPSKITSPLKHSLIALGIFFAIFLL